MISGEDDEMLVEGTARWRELNCQRLKLPAYVPPGAGLVSTSRGAGVKDCSQNHL